LEVERVSTTHNKDYSIIKLIFGHLRIAFVQARPKLGSEQMEDLLKECLEKTDLIVGDFNSHVPGLLLGKQIVNLRGKIIQQELLVRSLLITNPAGIPTWINKNSQSIIDLSISTTNYRTTIQEVAPKDHRALVIHTNSYVEPRTILKRPAAGATGEI